MPAQGGGGGGKSGRDVRAGGAYFELWAKDSLTPVLEGMKRKALAFSSFMQSVGKRAGIAGAALAAPLALLFRGGVNRAGDIARMSEQFRVPIDLMARLQHAAEDAGVSVEEVMSDTTGRFSKLVDRPSGVSAESIRAAADAQRRFAEATRALQYAMLPLLDALVPVVYLVTEFVKRNAALLQVLVPVAAGLIALGAAFSLLGTPLGAVTVGLGALVYLFRNELAEEIARFGESFQKVGEIFSQTWQGILDAVKGGDMELAFKILAVGVKAVWFEMLASMGKAFSDWIAANHNRIVALGALLGVAMGAKAGRVLGPWGMAGGAVLGGLGGGAAADALADELKAIGADPGLAARAGELRAELAGLAARAGGMAAGAGQADENKWKLYGRKVAEGFGSVAGNFNVYGTARSQFGFATETNKQTELLKRLAEGQEKLADKIVDGMVGALEVR